MPLCSLQTHHLCCLFRCLQVRLQTQSSSAPRYSGLLDCVRQTFAAEGVLGFYRGVSSPLAGQIVFNAAQFLAYSLAKDAVVATGKEVGEGLSVAEGFAAGALTGAAVALIECPIDLFKTQLQTQVFQPQPQFTTLPATIRAVLQAGGPLGVFQGIVPTLLRNVPAVSFYFGAYEFTRNWLARRGGVRVSELGAGQLLVAGAVGGVSYWALTYPLDAVKSTIQADALVPQQRRYGGVVSTARAMWAEGGMRRFFRGLTPCLMRAAPANAVCFVLYEKTRGVLDARL
jgi:solute carrier family 25 carnitine/acylcarnitine transporter 20/29